MRYAIVVPDGVADRPHPALEGKTALEAADIPHMDRLARDGRLGMVQTIPAGMKPGSDVANLSVLGYDPSESYTGRAPLEAAALGIELAPGEAVFRANTVTVKDGTLADYAAGHISTDEARELILQLDEALGIAGVKLVPGVGYRHLCVMADMADTIPDRSPPHDIMGESIDAHEPSGPGAERLLEIERASGRHLAGCAVNQRRVARGELPATHLWLWGGGVTPTLASFASLYGLTGGIISAVDLLKGIGRLAGLEIIEVPGATGYYDTDYAGKGAAACACLKRRDLVVVHVEAPDEAGHNGEPDEKVKALERIDRHILQPLLEEAARAGDLRILCLPDHPTPVELRTHTADPVPFVLWGPGIAAEGGDVFTESTAAAGAPSRVPPGGLMRLLTA